MGGGGSDAKSDIGGGHMQKVTLWDGALAKSDIRGGGGGHWTKVGGSGGSYTKSDFRWGH
jgi:hypothetical protein